MGEVITEEININSMIYEIRGKQVMLDSDLAKLYKCKNGTKEINQAVKRNIKKFPEKYMFMLNIEEINKLRSQFVTTNNMSRALPYVFTEQGVVMLATILKSNVAIEMSIKIIDAFVSMRKFISNNNNMFERMISVEYRLLDHDSKINELFNIFDSKKVKTSKIFFEGEIYDAYSLLTSLIKESSVRIIIIDNYLDNSILDILTNKKDNVNVLLVTRKNSIQKLSIDKFNKQYGNLEIKISNTFHDRFLIIDNVLYHIGASLKDLGNKCFAITKIEDNDYLSELLNRL